MDWERLEDVLRETAAVLADSLDTPPGKLVATVEAELKRLNDNRVEMLRLMANQRAPK